MASTAETTTRRAGGRVLPALGWLLRRPSLALGGALVGLIVLAAILAPVISPADPYAQNLANGLKPPSWAHPFGTDQFGRDTLSRVLWGAQISLLEVLVGVGPRRGARGGCSRGLRSVPAQSDCAPDDAQGDRVVEELAGA